MNTYTCEIGATQKETVYDFVSLESLVCPFMKYARVFILHSRFCMGRHLYVHPAPWSRYASLVRGGSLRGVTLSRYLSTNNRMCLVWGILFPLMCHNLIIRIYCQRVRHAYIYIHIFKCILGTISDSKVIYIFTLQACDDRLRD